MDSSTSTSWMGSFAPSEIDYVIMLVMTAFLGWRLAEVVRIHFSNIVCKPKNLSVRKVSESNDDVPAPMRSPLDGEVAVSPKDSVRIPPTQGLAAGFAEPTPTPTNASRPWAAIAREARAAGVASAPPGLAPPPGLEHFGGLLAAPQQQAVLAAEANGSWTKVVPRRTAPAPASSGGESPAARPAPAAFSMPAAACGERQVGRVVCWKEGGYGFIVDEDGERLFVRQGEVEGGEKLRAGQLVWFRRGHPQGKTATKALEVSLVSPEASRVLRQSAVKPTNQKLRPGDSDADAVDISPEPTSKALMYAPLKNSDSTPGHEAPISCFGAASDKNVVDNEDADLSAFLGSGPTDEIVENLKYAPQWVREKFLSQQAEKEKQLAY